MFMQKRVISIAFTLAILSFGSTVYAASGTNFTRVLQEEGMQYQGLVNNYKANLDQYNLEEDRIQKVLSDQRAFQQQLDFMAQQEALNEKRRIFDNNNPTIAEQLQLQKWKNDNPNLSIPQNAHYVPGKRARYVTNWECNDGYENSTDGEQCVFIKPPIPAWLSNSVNFWKYTDGISGISNLSLIAKILCLDLLKWWD